MGKLIDLNDRLEKMIRSKKIKIKKLNEEVEILMDEASKVRSRLNKLQWARQKRCRHDKGFMRHPNVRSDASFKNWLFCKKCHLCVGHENFDGSIQTNV